MYTMGGLIISLYYYQIRDWAFFWLLEAVSFFVFLRRIDVSLFKDPLTWLSCSIYPAK